MFLELNKGDKAFVVSGIKVIEVEVAFLRTSKYGSVTYFLKRDGEKYDCTFDDAGNQNFKNWRDGLWCRVPRSLVKTRREANRIAKLNKEYLSK